MVNKVINQNPICIKTEQLDVNCNKIHEGHSYGLLVKSGDPNGGLHIYERLVAPFDDLKGDILFIPLNRKFTTYALNLFHDKIFDKRDSNMRLKITIK